MRDIAFARYSLLQCLFLISEIRAAKTIKFQPVIRSRDRQSKYSIFLVKKLLKIINPDCQVKEMQRDIFIEAEWKSNADSVKFITEKSDYYRKLGSFKFLNGIINDISVIKFFQGSLTFTIPAWFAFDTVSATHYKTGETFYVPAWKVDDELSEILGRFRTNIIKAMYGMQHISMHCLYIFGASILPTLFFLIKSKAGIRLKRNTIKEEYLLALPVLWGVSSTGKNLSNGVLKQIDDGYLYGDEIKEGDIIHVFGKWKFDKAVTTQYEQSMNKLGYKYIHIDNFKLTPQFIFNLIAIQLRVFPALLQSMFSFKLNREAVMMSRDMIKGLYYYLGKNLEFANLRYKVDLVKDDYNPAHVINSIVARRYGVKTIGVQHTASPYDSPQLCFIDFDLYI